MDRSAEKPLFPKTSTKAHRTRKRPQMVTIAEDEEISDWTGKCVSSSKRVRETQAVSQKLRCPPDFDQGVSNVTVTEAAGPSNNSAASMASSPGTSARSEDVMKMQAPPMPVSVKERVAAYEKMTAKLVEVAVEPEGRVTRTKAKAMASSSGNAGGQVQGPSQKADIALLQKLVPKSRGKAFNVSNNKRRKLHEEDQGNSFVRKSAKLVPVPLTANKVTHMPASKRKSSHTVLTSANRMFAVNQNATQTTFAQKKRREEQKRQEEKEEEAVRKKKEMIKQKVEVQRKKHEEKMQKALASRKAQERKKAEQQARAERDKVEKLRQAAEREEHLRKEAQRKRAWAQQRALEIKKRRRLGEMQRLARIKEQKEIQKQLAAQRKKDADEAERQYMKCVQEEKEVMMQAQMERERALGAGTEKAAEENQQKAAAKAKEMHKMAIEAKDKQQQMPASLLDDTFIMPTARHAKVQPPLLAATAEDHELLDLSSAD